ncbi:MAG: molybdopterin-dependent oxidoreductase [Coriobacteriales bacterium]|jgi:thiosulfate reductase/polysulfide reductase chain A|nr:molybdopterin-dependent oxidoreductase [Coriobacteriales bacterium]
MRDKTISRRSFLVGSAATAALLTLGVNSMDNWLSTQAFADEDTGMVQVPTTCNACSNKCGFIAYVKDGRLWKIKGNPLHPNSKGMLCARGHGYAQIVYSKYRITDPLKNDGNGNFKAISWNQAYQEIGEKVQTILTEKGPEALALIEDPRPNGKYYSHRFINALGSGNYYHHSAACNLSFTSGNLLSMGASGYSSDITSSKFVVFIGRSYADGINPKSARSLVTARENGTKIVFVDPRLNNSANFGAQWLPINPGTDLALVLAISNVLVANNLYDADFVANETYGFDEWSAAIGQYTPQWAEPITGISAGVIKQLALDLAAAAPQSAIAETWRGAYGCSYQNSTECARAVNAVNALLGNFNKKGGALITSPPKPGSLDPVKFPATPKATERLGSVDFPLADDGPGSNLAVPLYAKRGIIKGIFFYNSNATMGYSNPQAWADALSMMDLKVCIDVQMSETAHLCDYVLPECSYLERTELPDFLGASQGVACARQKVVDLVNPNTRSCDLIYGQLAEACGVGQYFQFNLDELIEAQLQSLGADIDEYHEKGVTNVGDPVDIYAQVPAWKTPSGKFQFKSDLMAEHGLEPLIHWIPPKVMPQTGNGEFRLIGGKQAIHSHQMTTANEALMAITEKYHMERAWINAAEAAKLGIADGDLIEITSTENSVQVHCKATERLNPTAIWIPTHYGCSSPELKPGYGVGIPWMSMIPFQPEEKVGAAMTHEVIVKVRKVDE